MYYFYFLFYEKNLTVFFPFLFLLLVGLKDES